MVSEDAELEATSTDFCSTFNCNDKDFRRVLRRLKKGVLLVHFVSFMVLLKTLGPMTADIMACFQKNDADADAIYMDPDDYEDWLRGLTWDVREFPTARVSFFCNCLCLLLVWTALNFFEIPKAMLAKCASLLPQEPETVVVVKEEEAAVGYWYGYGFSSEPVAVEVLEPVEPEVKWYERCATTALKGTIIVLGYIWDFFTTWPVTAVLTVFCAFYIVGIYITGETMVKKRLSDDDVDALLKKQKSHWVAKEMSQNPHNSKERVVRLNEVLDEKIASGDVAITEEINDVQKAKGDTDALGKLLKLRGELTAGRHPNDFISKTGHLTEGELAQLRMKLAHETSAANGDATANSGDPIGFVSI